MPNFEDHINKARHNFEFLEQINNRIPNSLDWQVTVCYYVGLHLVNAHLVNYGLQYRTHKEVENALNPNNLTSLTKIAEIPYVKYLDLEGLSRRARYMTHGGNKSVTPALIHEKHLLNSIKHLDLIINYFKPIFEQHQRQNGNSNYSFIFPNIKLDCAALSKNNNLIYISKKEVEIIEVDSE